jgi:CCR4-NOT transcriptional regulation complex NOT5 subunit
MSAAEIIAELPKLSSEDLAVVRRRLRELEERDELQFLHDSADAMFQDLEKQEAGVLQLLAERLGV